MTRSYSVLIQDDRMPNRRPSQEQNPKVERSAAAEERTPSAQHYWDYCPNCGARLHNMGCKYRCPDCHYFMSCSDFD